jgi:hypothetical protein
MPSASRPFRPPFCPHPSCDFHRNPSGWRFVGWGSYTRTCPRVRRIPRFRCSQCRRTFSRQTFQTTYWLRRSELLHTLCERLVAGSGLRQIARGVGCAPSTVMRHAARLGRHSLLFLERHRPPGPPAEPVVIDGFESFAFSPYYPLHLNLAVGAESHFVYALTESELRRKGRMSAAQKRKRTQEEARWGRPDPQAIEQGVAALVALVVPPGTAACLRSDAHRAYPRALRRLPDRTLRHEVTSSKAARTPGNPLFAVNRQDQMLRHCGANHRRETIAFSKLRAAVIERAYLQAVFMGFMKARSEKKRDATPAQWLGIREHPLRVREFLARRLFATRCELPALLATYYRRAVITRRLPHAPRHQLRLAY